MILDRQGGGAIPKEAIPEGNGDRSYYKAYVTSWPQPLSLVEDENLPPKQKSVTGTLISVVSLLRLFSPGLVYAFPQSANDKWPLQSHLSWSGLISANKCTKEYDSKNSVLENLLAAILN